MPRSGNRRRSQRIQRIAHERLQRRLAEHLREVEANRVRAGEPRRSIRLHFHFDRRLRYFLFGEDGYINPNDPGGDEFPRHGWRRDRVREHQEEQAAQGEGTQQVHDGTGAADGAGAPAQQAQQGQGTATGHATAGDETSEVDSSSAYEDSDKHYTPSSPEGSENGDTRSWVRRDSDEHHTPSEGGYDDASGDSTSAQGANS